MITTPGVLILTLSLGAAISLGCSQEGSDAGAANAPAKETAAATAPAAQPTGAPAAPPAPLPPAADPKELAEKGRQYYLSSCIACHNADPAVDGALGPAVAGASMELIEARVMRAAYPEGYTPKRDTRVMIAMPFLEKQLPALAAYLAVVESE